MNLSNRNIIVYRSEMVFRESEMKTKRAIVLNVLIIWPVPAGMSCRHNSLKTAAPLELVSSDSLTASFSHCSLQKSVIPRVFGWLPGEFARDRTHKRISLLIIFL